MANKVYFSKLDCSQAYHVIQMADERSVQLLAFNVRIKEICISTIGTRTEQISNSIQQFYAKISRERI